MGLVLAEEKVGMPADPTFNQPPTLAEQGVDKKTANVARKLAARKLAARKLAARKLAARKLAARKLAARKLAARKLAARKLAARKLAARKLAARKLAARKLAARKLAALSDTERNAVVDRHEAEAGWPSRSPAPLHCCSA